jgi:hypothetical protein
MAERSACFKASRTRHRGGNSTVWLVETAPRTVETPKGPCAVAREDALSLAKTRCRSRRRAVAREDARSLAKTRCRSRRRKGENFSTGIERIQRSRSPAFQRCGPDAVARSTRDRHPCRSDAGRSRMSRPYRWAASGSTRSGTVRARDDRTRGWRPRKLANDRRARSGTLRVGRSGTI